MGRLSAKVLNITTPFVGHAASDLLAADSKLLTAAQKKDVQSKFGHVSGSWCCAPVEEMKKGAPRAAHFQLARV